MASVSVGMTYGAATYGGATVGSTALVDNDITDRVPERTLTRVIEANERVVVRSITASERNLEL